MSHAKQFDEAKAQHQCSTGVERRRIVNCRWQAERLPQLAGLQRICRRRKRE